jgi:hypothetical protein
MVYCLTGYEDSISPALGNVYLWGVIRDLNAGSPMRPTGLALQMLNDAIGGDFHQVSASGTGSSGLSAAAFLSTNGWSLVIASANATPTQVSISLPASGDPPTQAYMLSAPSITSDNETATNVKIVPTTFSGGIVTIPACGVVELKP